MTKASGQKQKRQQRKGAALQADSSQPQPRATSKEEEYTGYLIVHFQDGRVKFDVPGESLYTYAKNQGLGQLIDLLQSSTLDSPERSQRVIRDTSEQELREMEKAALELTDRY